MDGSVFSNGSALDFTPILEPELFGFRDIIKRLLLHKQRFYIYIARKYIIK